MGLHYLKEERFTDWRAPRHLIVVCKNIVTARVLGELCESFAQFAVRGFLTAKIAKKSRKDRGETGFRYAFSQARMSLISHCSIRHAAKMRPNAGTAKGGQ
jgi:hypothetical protein